jgi:hypothetical protein
MVVGDQQRSPTTALDRIERHAMQYDMYTLDRETP